MVFGERVDVVDVETLSFGECFACDVRAFHVFDEAAMYFSSVLRRLDLVVAVTRSVRWLDYVSERTIERIRACERSEWDLFGDDAEFDEFVHAGVDVAVADARFL